MSCLACLRNEAFESGWREYYDRCLRPKGPPVSLASITEAIKQGIAAWLPDPNEQSPFFNCLDRD